VTLIGDLLQIYVLVLIIRAVLSFFPVRPDSGLIPVMRALDTVIDPLLLPLRRVIPPLGMFDMSFLALILIVEVVASFFPSNIRIL
jgi:YggT family protein